MDDKSLWKKELSFGRKPKEEHGAEETPATDEQPAADEQPATGEQSASLWKKELSLERTPTPEAADETPAPEPAVEEPVVVAEEHVVDEPVPAEPVAEAVEETVWKKEVSFGRKAAPEVPVEPEAVVAEPAELLAAAPEAEPVPAENVWKREVSVDRKPEAEPVESATPGEEVQDVADEPVAEVAPVPVQPVAEEPLAAEAKVQVEPEAVSEPWSAPPALPPEPEAPIAIVPAAVAPVEVQPPVAKADLPPLPEAAAKVPFWKKELSLGGKKREKAPKKSKEEATPHAAAVAEDVPATASADVHPPVAEADLPPLPEAAAKAPFWKKELSLGGKKREQAPKKRKQKEAPQAPAVEHSAAVVAADVHPPVPAADLPPLPEAAAKVPFWKKNLSLGGGKDGKPKAPKVKAERAAAKENGKQPKAPKQAKEPKQKKAPKVKADRGSSKGRIVGLKIGASQLAAARVSNNGSAELLQVAREPLPSGIVVGGELRDPAALAEALKEFFAKHGLPKKGVRLGIANNRIGVRTFEIGGIQDPKQLDNAIRFRAQETLPIPIDEAVLDYQVLGEGVDEEGQPTKRILLVVAYRELIDRYVDACKKAGIILSGIDLEAFALLRALQAPQEGVGTDAAAALVVVAIGHERSTFAVSDGRVCEFTRVLEWGGSALNVAIARAVDAAPSEVEDAKRALALTDEMVPDGLTADQAKKAREAMRRAIQTFARELVSSLQYYQNQPGSLGIGEIVLSGGTAHLPGLAGELERLIGVHVRVGDPLARMKVSKKVGQPEQIGSLAVAIGLGIED